MNNEGTIYDHPKSLEWFKRNIPDHSEMDVSRDVDYREVNGVHQVKYEVYRRDSEGVKQYDSWGNPCVDTFVVDVDSEPPAWILGFPEDEDDQ